MCYLALVCFIGIPPATQVRGEDLLVCALLRGDIIDGCLLRRWGDGVNGAERQA